MNAFRLLASAAAAAALAAATAACSAASLGTAIADGRSAASASAQPSQPADPGQVKEVHSPSRVTVDEQLPAGHCRARAVDAAAGKYLPDHACTPGAVDPAVTQATIDSTICRAGYTASVRPSSAAMAQVKAESLREYGESASATTEYDHLVSLELGGANSVSNLWPEPNRTGATGTTNPKDAVENALHRAVCAHTVTLAAAQTAIAHDWTTALHVLGL
ncbi:hypothetical protein SA2016_0759 [Sinomonas atrocyanea]|uniref:HNH endonuclease n=1 Tax=Sinomonas atrocyanea TaxID=37927 RepID=A0A126ZW91_9MICC|nr:hypothetical protein [Sinomonas atrocyanea]AMM31449.1 hypothetical protein SA2016_0759 [Sinomonas atrocyanea]GEB63734.1 hypothetical protein SAT01_11820 [Sinomonas atrocyanea]GGG64014.1 hypothetical protein GCM10007172_14200 [Sinomonas atrocyanea]